VGSSGAVAWAAILPCSVPCWGVRVEEFTLSPGQIVPLFGVAPGRLWSDAFTATMPNRRSGTQRGSRRNPAITRRSAGKGCAWYISTRLCDERNELLVRDALAAAG